MARRLPPLNALRAFEAAARHLSFTRAAAELNVTQAAISHQVKALEARLGVPLFRRVNRGLLLTEEGQRYLPPVRDAFDQLASATDQLKRHDATGALTVSVVPSFAAKWLVPRLTRFRERAPEIDVRISATDHLVDFDRDAVDLGIRYGAGKWPTLLVDELFSDNFFPVCGPDLASAARPLDRPADLRQHVLLHEEQTMVDWETWLAAAGARDVDATRGPMFSHGDLVVQAALDGQGVALGRTPLVEDDLASGRLVKPFALSLAGEWAYYLVCPKATAERPKIAAFRGWLKDEAAAHVRRRWGELRRSDLSIQKEDGARLVPTR